MKKYKVYIKKEFADKYGFLITEIFGYSKEDALFRSNIKKEHTESVGDVF